MGGDYPLMGGGVPPIPPHIGTPCILILLVTKYYLYPGAICISKLSLSLLSLCCICISGLCISGKVSPVSMCPVCLARVSAFHTLYSSDMSSFNLAWDILGIKQDLSLKCSAWKDHVQNDPAYQILLSN